MVLGVRRWLGVLLVGILMLWACVPAAEAGLKDDRYDGNIFALYAGNGSLVPPRVTLADALGRPERATVLVLYLDDSQDCKQFAPTISQLQAFFGRRTDFIPITVDALPATPSPLTTEPSHYFQGFVPQTVVFDLDGQVVLNQAGAIPYATLDGTLRQVFGLPPADGPERQAAPVNEVNQELVPPA